MLKCMLFCSMLAHLILFTGIASPLQYEHIKGNATEEFCWKHLPCSEQTRKQVLGLCAGSLCNQNRSTMQVNNGDRNYWTVRNACENWGQDRMWKIEQNGRFQIGTKKFSNRSTLIVSETILLHIERGFPGCLQFVIENITNLELHLGWNADGKIDHYNHCL